jgi:hypothetical protein
MKFFLRCHPEGAQRLRDLGGGKHRACRGAPTQVPRFARDDIVSACPADTRAGAPSPGRVALARRSRRYAFARRRDHSATPPSTTASASRPQLPRAGIGSTTSSSVVAKFPVPPFPAVMVEVVLT